MMFDEADSELLKKWIIAQLDKLEATDADSDVLADYVLALVKTDDPEEVAKANCNENLADFLGDGTERFVIDLFSAISTKHYDPSTPAPKPVATNTSSAFRSPPVPRSSRKRGFNDRDGVQDQGQCGGQHSEGDRPMKQPRRSGRDNFARSRPLPPAVPPPGIPAFDPSNPIASLFAMQQAMGLLPPDFSLANLPTSGGVAVQSGLANRCRDYDTKGFCTRGAHCPYEHGEDPHIITGNEYDPTQPAILNIQPTRTGSIDTSSSSHKRGRGKRGRRSRGNLRGGSQRSDFSKSGPNHDKSITSIVVEQIPPDKFDEPTVRDFFGQFGNIEHVTMHDYKETAVVKYDSYDSARSAWDSPKVVFDNRFVKVYWYRGDNIPQPLRGLHNHYRSSADVDMKDEEPQIDLEEVTKKQEEAQRRHEEKKERIAAARKERDAIDAQMQQLHDKKKEMLAKVAAKAGESAEDTMLTDKPEENEKTKGLRAQLAQLEEEAKALGIDPNTATNDWHGLQYYPRGRGGFRGRPRGRAGYSPSFRGGWAGGAVKRLDNRPKTVCLAFFENAYEDHEESLRSHLLFNAPEAATLAKHPNRQDAALVTFGERFQAENFMAAAGRSDFPLAGKADLSWYKATQTDNGSNAQATDVKTDVSVDGNGRPDKEMKEEDPPRDLDVADVDDRWG